MAVTDYIERAVAYFVINKKGRDHDLFTRQAQFKDVQPSISVTSTIPNDMPLEYTDVKGGNKFPPLRVSTTPN